MEEIEREQRKEEKMYLKVDAEVAVVDDPPCLHIQSVEASSMSSRTARCRSSAMAAGWERSSSWRHEEGRYGVGRRRGGGRAGSGSAEDT